MAGSDLLRSPTPFAADVRAARGFNGDIARCLTRWRSGNAEAPRVARKTLVAAAGIVSMRNGTWTTDRATVADGWTRIAEDEAGDLHRLLAWADGSVAANADELAAALRPGGIVDAVVVRFGDEIGFWG